jgi:signal transduction histidine kinase
MDALINELSLYSKIDNNSIPYNFVKLKVESYFDDCLEDITMDMERQNVTLSYRNSCSSDTRVVADPEQIRRVIGNIITNAVKYNKKTERNIEIQVQPYGEHQILVGIRDNGNGISDADLPNIFKRMYRTDSSRNSSTGGSGLGLSIAKKIIEEHGGTIWAESKENIGTRIVFTLNKYEEKGTEEAS